MQISIEEVSRLLALPPRRREKHRKTPTAVGRDSIDQEDGTQAEINASSTAIEIECVKRELGRLPDVREDRVKDLKDRIENGVYQISGDDIAALIIRRALADDIAG